jgi:MYXO-CTERM domain-containing protein
MSATLDDVESGTTAWTTTGTDTDKIWSRPEATPGNHLWRGVDYGSPSDTALESPELNVSPTDDLILSFEHRYQFEASQGTNYDGGVIEVSTNGGGTWQDISTFGDPGYIDTIGDFQGQATNVLKGRQGYVDQSLSWPATDKVTVNMGKTLAGQKVKIRFRIGTDEASGMSGWEIDNISLQGITNKPFDAIVVDASTCSAMTTGSTGAGGAPSSTSTGGLTTSTGGVGGDPSTTGAGTGATGSGGEGGNGEDIEVGGCGCFMGGSSSNPLYATPLFLLSALLIRRRRR